MYFRNKRLRKAWLVKCLKSPVSKHLLKVNMLKGQKYCWKLHEHTFVIFL